MSRLYRPYIPTEVLCRVILRQLGELWPNELIRSAPRLSELLLDKKIEYANLIGCAGEADLRLDHDPALATRQRKGEGKETVYFPDANDPEFLIYREKIAHDVKTRIRGEHGQYSDIVLIKRERRRRAGEEQIAKGMAACGLGYRMEKQKRASDAKPKRKWPSRPFAKRRKP